MGRSLTFDIPNEIFGDQPYVSETKTNFSLCETKIYWTFIGFIGFIVKTKIRGM